MGRKFFERYGLLVLEVELHRAKISDLPHRHPPSQRSGSGACLKFI
jgi:hypothetical protein